MRNYPNIDGKIKNNKEFLNNMLIDWEDASILYENWDVISQKFKNSGNVSTLDDISGLDLSKNIKSALIY